MFQWHRRGLPRKRFRSPRSAPISSGCESPRRHQQEVGLDSLFVGGKRQEYLKGCPLPHVALYPNATVVRFDDHLSLKHPDSQAFLFRRLEWPEQGIAQERCCHSAAIIRNRKCGVSVLSPGPDFDASPLTYSIPRVQEQIGDDTAKLFAIRHEFRQRLKFFGKFNAWHSVHILDRLLNQQV